MGTETLSDTTKGEVMGKLEGKVAVITGGSSGMALANAMRFVEEGAYVFITGRRHDTESTTPAARGYRKARRRAACVATGTLAERLCGASSPGCART
jgi:NAD(P)-dependent dehydrogenase (short-subunit alcohol dehydrogenase family)